MTGWMLTSSDLAITGSEHSIIIIVIIATTATCKMIKPKPEVYCQKLSLKTPVVCSHGNLKLAIDFVIEFMNEFKSFVCWIDNSRD